MKTADEKLERIREILGPALPPCGDVTDEDVERAKNAWNAATLKTATRLPLLVGDSEDMVILRRALERAAIRPVERVAPLTEDVLERVCEAVYDRWANMDALAQGVLRGHISETIETADRLRGLGVVEPVETLRCICGKSFDPGVVEFYDVADDERVCAMCRVKELEHILKTQPPAPGVRELPTVEELADAAENPTCVPDDDWCPSMAVGRAIHAFLAARGFQPPIDADAVRAGMAADCERLILEDQRPYNVSYGPHVDRILKAADRYAGRLERNAEEGMERRFLSYVEDAKAKGYDAGLQAARAQAVADRSEVPAVAPDDEAAVEAERKARGLELLQIAYPQLKGYTFSGLNKYGQEQALALHDAARRMHRPAPKPRAAVDREVGALALLNANENRLGCGPFGSWDNQYARPMKPSYLAIWDAAVALLGAGGGTAEDGRPVLTDEIVESHCRDTHSDWDDSTICEAWRTVERHAMRRSLLATGAFRALSPPPHEAKEADDAQPQP